jgi:hypothetical protein
MHAMSNRPPPLRGLRDDARTPRTFTLRDDLYRAFEKRARDLECSIDWLVGEAMKRLLVETGTGLPQTSPVTAPPPPPRRRTTAPPAAPPVRLPPPPVRRPTGSFVGPKPAGVELIALRLGQERTIVDRDRFLIGRGAKHAQLVVPDPNVSRQHAILERTPRGWVVVDMASTNGVYLNGARVTRAAVRAGDVIEIGPARIVVERA